MNKNYLVYCLIRIAVYPIGWMPFPWIRKLGNILGTIGYYTMRSYRKRALSNLALASRLALTPQQIISYAKQSFQNLATTCLEYPKLAQIKDLSRVIRCETPERVEKSAIYFCAHQSNWEVLFLDATLRQQGIAIGRPIKNPYLYNWIVSIREKNGGKMIAPRNAIKEGLRNLRKGFFFGIVGDQGMPDSGYSFPFLGRRAWTSTTPALLAYKTKKPIIYASLRRERNGFITHYSPPIHPNPDVPMDKEVPRLMDETLKLLENKIECSPGDWLWQHNRWKQQSMRNLYRRFRQDAICLILPDDQTLLPHLTTFKQIYESSFLFIFAPKNLLVPIEADEIVFYERIEETLVADYRFKLVFNFTDFPLLRKHFKKFSALEVLSLQDLRKIASEHLPEKPTLSDIMQRALCRPNSIWKKDAV